MNRKVLVCNEAPKAVGPYSQGIALDGAKELYYFSGMLPIVPDKGIIVEESADKQTSRILQNIDNLLKANGLSASNVIKTMVFLTDMNNFAAMNAEYAKYFNTDPPARSCVEVSKLPLGASVEIEIIAAK